MESFSAYKSKYSFTLIELLVVIAIIAILASLLLPSLSKARERGKDISCRNNLKTFHLYMTMYSNDFQNYYPQWQGGTLCWSRQIGELYLGHKYDNENYPILKSNIKNFHCPAGIIKQEYAKKPRGYAMNAYVAGSEVHYNDGPSTGETSINRRNVFNKGNNMMLVADFGSDGHETFFGGNAGNIEYLYRYHGKYIMNRHQMMVNYVVKNGAVMQSPKKNDGAKGDVGLDIIWFAYDQNNYMKNNTKYPF